MVNRAPGAQLPRSSLERPAPQTYVRIRILPPMRTVVHGPATMTLQPIYRPLIMIMRGRP